MRVDYLLLLVALVLQISGLTLIVFPVRRLSMGPLVFGVGAAIWILTRTAVKFALAVVDVGIKPDVFRDAYVMVWVAAGEVLLLSTVVVVFLYIVRWRVDGKNV